VTTTQVPTRTERSTRTARPRPGPGSRLRVRTATLTAGRLPWVVGWFGCAVWAGFFPFVSTMVPQRIWGTCAVFGYTAALAAAALLPQRRAIRVSTALALLGAVVVPLCIMVAEGRAQSEVLVVQNSAVQLLHSGSPYLPDPHQTIGYDPYLPAMALFGLPRALLGDHVTALRMVGDARIWFLAAFSGCLTAAWRLLQDPQPGPLSSAPTASRAPERSWGAAFAAVTASPLVALVAVTGGVDLPLIGCLILALALAGRGHATRAGLVLALACAIKWTAWPALPVAALLLHQLYGRRAALRCSAVAVALGAALIAPFALLSPQAIVEQVVRFPLGLSRMHTPADSPLPGHLLADLGPGGRIACFVLLGLGGAAVAVWIAVSPPYTVVQAADRLAVGVSVAFLLAPAGRYGYLELPALLLLWPRLARPPVAVRVPVSAPAVSVPAAVVPAPAVRDLEPGNSFLGR
jgi:hypothetical protein